MDFHFCPNLSEKRQQKTEIFWYNGRYPITINSLRMYRAEQNEPISECCAQSGESIHKFHYQEDTPGFVWPREDADENEKGCRKL